jgi:hypothetical protein
VQVGHCPTRMGMEEDSNSLRVVLEDLEDPKGNAIGGVELRAQHAYLLPYRTNSRRLSEAHVRERNLCTRRDWHFVFSLMTKPPPTLRRWLSKPGCMINSRKHLKYSFVANMLPSASKTEKRIPFGWVWRTSSQRHTLCIHELPVEDALEKTHMSRLMS